VAKRNFEKVAFILLDFGADPELKDHLERKPRELANKRNHREISDVIILSLLKFYSYYIRLRRDNFTKTSNNIAILCILRVFYLQI
jgi:hypothetical protein